MTGKVTFVGAGCGDPRLITVRAAEILADADFVLFDPDVHPDVRARVKAGATQEAVGPQMSAVQIGTLLADEAEKGKHAVRLAWGDPLLFAWGDAEGVAVARREVPLEIIPGIGPLIAVGAFAGVPLTRSTDASPSVGIAHVTRGHESLHDWDKLATATDTLAVVCHAETLAETARSLVFYGRASTDRATIIENVSLPSQRTIETTLGQVPLLPRSSVDHVVLVVGERAQRTVELEWFENLPLFGKRVLVTRTRDQAGGVAALLRGRGADPVLMPTIEIHPPRDPAPMIDVVPALGSYGWVVFTSVNGVERLWTEIRRQGKDARAFGAAKIAAVGPGTSAALERVGIAADLVPKEHRGEGLAAELLAAIGEERPRVLVARAEVARDVAPDALRAAGCAVDVVAVYMTRSPPRPLLDAIAALLDAGEIDAVTFTSSSTVEHLADALEARAAELLAKTCVASIGPVTSETAEKRGIRVDVVAPEATVAALVGAVERHLAPGGQDAARKFGTRAI
jgi:uroporphyrinogen III methyltransferase / synthase